MENKMSIPKRILITIISILLMGISVFSCFFFATDINDIQIIIAIASIVVTIILGATTYYQTEMQIKLDKLEKTPFYKLVFFNNNEDQVYRAFYQQNCIPLIRIGDNYYIDFLFENASDINVASIEIDYGGVENAGLTGSSNKIKELNQQENSIAGFAEYINSATEEIIGDGSPLFEEWLKFDTGKNTNYDKRVRELILHFYYYYDCDFNEDLTPYRNSETANNERKETIRRIISRGPSPHNKDKSFYEYFCESRASIMHQLKPYILEWNENKEEIRNDIKLEQLDIDKNLIVNTDRFHQFIKLPNEGKANFTFTLTLHTVYKYSYKQIIEVSIDNKLFNDLSIIPDERDILSKALEIDKIQYRTGYNEHIQHDREELHNLKDKRAFVFIDNYKSTIVEVKRRKQKNRKD